MADRQALASALMSDDQAAMQPETYANPVARKLLASALTLPQRAIQNSQYSLDTGNYDPSAPIEAATTIMGGGLGGVGGRSGTVLGSGPIRDRIEKAYLSLTKGQYSEGVPLAKLRAALPDLDRPVVDAELKNILKNPDETAMLMRHDDPRQIDKANHAAAFNPAGEPFHVLWIGQPRAPKVPDRSSFDPKLIGLD